MRRSVVHWACICALLAFPIWSAGGCGDTEGGDGGTGTGASGGSGGTGGTGGGTGGTGGTGGSAPELTLEQQVVGAWTQSGSCDGTDIEIGEFICPGGRVRGAETIGNFDFLICGTWTAQEPEDVTARAQLISVQDPGDPANEDVFTFEYTYDWDNDQLVLHGACDIPLQRLEGGVTADDCESSTCTSGGGSGPVSCGTDCDCGRCWYCESGTCRYGGEGEFGCFRGCGEFIP
ncbi:MAG: hypothetical protein JRF54_02325 [Deltaproteobacteria bacterium]|nr:hypothetical protein [Deltaproteobacteria bacterium]MBW2403097.1 hypothetical protein [Deltaproteobacteria bacterium]MBW2545891.1 hypothetical protein [Deltaproteobacteria bacterium]MBW2717558.1 hypothetical protein [Deltaproteobacteria bacterium]